MRTTPPAPVNPAELVPELTALARPAVRLHPRPGGPAVGDSSLGGPLAWPSDRSWPICRPGQYDHLFDDAPKCDVPLVPVLQLYRRDVPQLPFPEGADVLQVLWCAFDHDPYSAPEPRLFWWASPSDIGAPPPPHSATPARTVPQPCVLHPESISEYPSWDLPGPLYERVTSGLAGGPWSYDEHLSVAPGVKVGGYPDWCQQSEWPSCSQCGVTMAHLVTVASWELDPGDELRWLPLEDRAVLEDPLGRDAPAYRAVQQPAGLMLGDVGSIYLFVCLTCPAMPFASVFQN